MQISYRSLLKHSAIYGIGQLLSRLASVLLLPVYTSYLSPADYGVVAILDFFGNILAILIGAGMGAAATRYHFETKDASERSQVWWTGLAFVVVTGMGFLLAAMLSREVLADWTLGSAVAQGGYFFGLILPTMWMSVVGQYLDTYLRAQKRSSLSVGINLFRLVLNIGLNVYFLAVLHYGITGILIGNFLTAGVATIILFVIFFRSAHSFSFHLPLLTKLWKFGGPLIVTTLLSSFMHLADRYLLRLFLDVEQVGLYSLAYTIGQGAYLLFSLPFIMIWSVVIYEIAEQPNAKDVYVRVFEYYFYGMMLLMLGFSFFSKQLLELMVPLEYLPATEIIPIICLAYIFFSLHEHFKVPVMLQKKTSDLLLSVSVASVVNILANIFLIPIFGVIGAAWASVVTFMTFSFVGLWKYRKIDCYDYPFWKCGMVLGGMVGSYIGYKWLAQAQGESLAVMSLAIGIWVGWFLMLFGTSIRWITAELGWISLKSPFSAFKEVALNKR